MGIGMGNVTKVDGFGWSVDNFTFMQDYNEDILEVGYNFP